jgi:hypothetical protein
MVISDQRKGEDRNRGGANKKDKKIRSNSKRPGMKFVPTNPNA